MVQYLKQVKLNNVLSGAYTKVIKFRLELLLKKESCDPGGAHSGTSEGLVLF